MKSPFKFLDSYTKEDRDIFFGREREIEELYHRVFESKIMLVYGVSGTGKSSLIHCGLANKFQDTDWLPLVVRRGQNMNDSMAAAIRAYSITPQNNEILTAIQFRKAVRSLYLDHYKPVYFIFDQFEELFIFGNKDERKVFIQSVKSITESDIQCRFIFVMREEYMANFTEFERYISSIFQNRVRIEKMSHQNAVEAIKGPCRVSGIRTEEGFAETLLEKLSPGSGDVELTYLQVFLDRIFRMADTEKPAFTIDLLGKVGNVSDLLGSFLDEQISLLSDPDTGLAVLKSFVSVKGTKQAMSVGEVQDYILTLGRTPDEVVLAELIQNFVSLRILRDRDQHDRYELRHDSLAAKIFEKFTLVEKELLEVRKFVENAYYAFETRKVLLNKEDLEYINAYGSKLLLPVFLSEFLEQCRSKLEFQKRTFVRITRLSALVFLILVAAILRQAAGKLTAVKEKVLIGTALLYSESDPVTGTNIIEGIWTKYKNSTVLKQIILTNYRKLLSSDSASSKIAAVYQRGAGQIVMTKEIVRMDISGSGNFLMGWLSDNSVFTINSSTGRLQTFESGKTPMHLELSGNDSLLAVACSDGSGYVTDLKGIKKYTFTCTPNKILNTRLVRFIPGDVFQLAVVKDNNVDLYSKNGEIANSLKGHTDRINAVDISPDGKFIASASCDRKVLVWCFSPGQSRYSLYDSITGHRDTVWSCQFNSRGNYILTASADSTQKIWNLTGQELNTTYYYTRNAEGSPRVKSANSGEQDYDSKDQRFAPYYRKACDAKFSPDNYCIIATNYTGADTSNKNHGPSFNKFLLFDVGSKFYTEYYTEFSGMSHSDENALNPQEFKDMVIAPSGNLAACEQKDAGVIDLCATDGLRLMRVNGSNPVMTDDGKYLYWITGNTINRMLVSADEIMRIFETSHSWKESSKNYDNLVGI
jgi:WD40 repeat protein